jgi:phenylacetate-coenzyme A ligase PaaK-like adenylate-forming protein
MPQAREHYKEIFGAPLLDNYSMGECLFLTNGCSTTGGMHVNQDWAILEVVDEDNQPVPDGEKGAKVLITNLANYVQPIIRYEVGDVLTMATEDCDCGNNMPRIDHVEGRDSDVFQIKTENEERSLQPTIFELALGRMLDVREYQIIQEDNTQFRILVEPLPGRTFDRGRSDELMRKQLADYDLDKQLEVKIEAVAKLQAEENKKFRRIVPLSANQPHNGENRDDIVHERAAS